MSDQQEKVRDPVCGMLVDPTGPHHHDHNGTGFHFCSGKCLSRFQASPSQFLGEAVPPPAATPGRYTCPMHPEIIREGPDSCPICGMALEPLEPAAEEEENPELADMMRRFIVSLSLTLPVFTIAMAEMVPGNPLASALAPRTAIWLGSGKKARSGMSDLTVFDDSVTTHRVHCGPVPM